MRTTQSLLVKEQNIHRRQFQNGNTNDATVFVVCFWYPLKLHVRYELLFPKQHTDLAIASSEATRALLTACRFAHKPTRRVISSPASFEVGNSLASSALLVGAMAKPVNGPSSPNGTAATYYCLIPSSLAASDGGRNHINSPGHKESTSGGKVFSNGEAGPAVRA